MTDLLIGNGELGKALSRTLGQGAVALLRGHGNVVVGETVQQVVYRAIQTELNARLQLQAIMLGGPLIYLAPQEAAKVNARSATQCHPDKPHLGTVEETNSVGTIGEAEPPTHAETQAPS
jgi:ribulose-5-phosphate 4-epimerase/fuculose-1-phosphate aldolase